MKKTNCVILFLLIANLGYSQTIINAERLTNTAKTNIYSLAFSYSGKSGNLNTSELVISPTFILLKPKNEYRLFGGYSFQSYSGNAIQKSGFLHIRHNYKLANRLKTFEFFQIQNNDVLLLNKRILFGAGLRYELVQKDSLKLAMELGLMREIENLDKNALNINELDVSENYRITYVNSFKWILNKSIAINNVVYYQPNIIAFNDFRILNDFNLIVSLTKGIALITELNIRYDSKPPGTLKSIDNSLSFGLNIQFFK